MESSQDSVVAQCATSQGQSDRSDHAADWTRQDAPPLPMQPQEEPAEDPSGTDMGSQLALTAGNLAALEATASIEDIDTSANSLAHDDVPADTHNNSTTSAALVSLGALVVDHISNITVTGPVFSSTLAVPWHRTLIHNHLGVDGVRGPEDVQAADQHLEDLTWAFSQLLPTRAHTFQTNDGTDTAWDTAGVGIGALFFVHDTPNGTNDIAENVDLDDDGGTIAR